MTMESDARCSGGGGGGGGGGGSTSDAEGSEAGENGHPSGPAPSTPDLDMEEDSSSQDQHNNNNNLGNGSATTGSHNLTPSSREMRNRAEKQRRDKLNTYITELATLNPLIAGGDKKMDKTSVLRLSAAYLRLHRTVWHSRTGNEEPNCCTPSPAVAAGPNPPSTASSMPLPANMALVPATPKLEPLTNGGSPKPCGPVTNVLQERRNNFYSSTDFPLPYNVTEQMLENMDGFMLILTSTGKVIYVSQTVAKLLGHSQNDLMGQSLFNITCPTDHDELRKNLQPDSLEEEAGPSHREPEFRKHRRSFFLKLSQRATSRGEHTQYELVHIVGHLRVPGGQEVAPPSTHLARKNTRIRDSNQVAQTGSQQETVLVAVGKLSGGYRRDLSILDASKDEYVTRHTLEGHIIYCDHRISVVAGYMAEEVAGLSAFSYMHQEDVGWTIVSLRQMYSSGGGYGTSTYRLISKTGQFIYLRTHGHLEYDEMGQKPASFICVNTLLSEEEGEQGVQDMKLRFSANVGAREALLHPDFTKMLSMFKSPTDNTRGSSPKPGTMDQLQLESLISAHLSEVPASPCSDDAMPDPQYLKCAIVSRSLPPPSTQIGIVSSRRRESSTGGSPGTMDHHPSSPNLIRSSTHRASPNGSIKNPSSPNGHDPLSPSYRHGSPSSPIHIKPEITSPYSQNSNSPPSHIADPMITGIGTCTTLLHSHHQQRQRDSYQTTTTMTATSLLLETSVYEQVTSSSEIRRTKRGRPPRLGQNKRSLSSENEGTNNKRICSMETASVFETEERSRGGCNNDSTPLMIRLEDRGRQQDLARWDENIDSPASHSSLLSNTTDFYNLELDDETGDHDADFQSLLPSLGDLIDTLKGGEGDASSTPSPSQHSCGTSSSMHLPTATAGVSTSLGGDSLEDSSSVHGSIHRLKPNKLNSQTDVGV